VFFHWVLRNLFLWARSEINGSAQEMYVFKSEARSTKFETRLKIQKFKCSKRNVKNITKIPGNPTIQATDMGTGIFVLVIGTFDI